MARSESASEQTLKDLIARSVNPVLKTAGFKRSEMNYHRRLGEVVQVVNLQVSHGSTADEKTFYVNAGVAFDAIAALLGLEPDERPKEFECDNRGTRNRLGGLISHLPSGWTVRADQDLSELVPEIEGAMKELVHALDLVDGISAYRRHPWFERWRPAPQRAQVLYLLGDLDGSFAEVQGLALTFADRQNANRAEWWIQRLKLAKLEGRSHGSGASSAADV